MSIGHISQTNSIESTYKREVRSFEHSIITIQRIETQGSCGTRGQLDCCETGKTW